MNMPTIVFPPILVTALLIFVPSSASCSSLQKQPSPSTEAGKISLTAPDNGSHLTLHPGELLRISLPANPSTGYDWHVISMPDAHLKLIEQEFMPGSDTLRVGAPGVTVLVFRAVSPTGRVSGNLELGYFRSWEGASTAEKRYALRITVEP